jgi:diaminopimelate epimerase
MDHRVGNPHLIFEFQRVENLMNKGMHRALASHSFFYEDDFIPFFVNTERFKFVAVAFLYMVAIKFINPNNFI